MRQTRGPWEFQRYPLPEPEPELGAILVQIGYANVCGSDLHWWRGDYDFPEVGRILEHEMVGRVQTLGVGVAVRIRAAAAADVLAGSVFQYTATEQNLLQAYACPCIQPVAAAILQALAGHEMHPLFPVAIALGFRPAEALDLRWHDLDPEGVHPSLLSIRRCSACGIARVMTNESPARSSSRMRQKRKLAPAGSSSSQSTPCNAQCAARLCSQSTTGHTAASLLYARGVPTAADCRNYRPH